MIQKNIIIKNAIEVLQEQLKEEQDHVLQNQTNCYYQKAKRLCRECMFFSCNILSLNKKG